MKKLIIVILFFCSSFLVFAADTITAPNDVSLSCVRKQSKESISLTLTYYSDADGKTITVQATTGTGTPVAGAKLFIKGGDLTDYTLLITGSSGDGSKTLENATSFGDNSIENIYLKLDASGVTAGASGLNVPWTYTLTYTLTQ